MVATLASGRLGSQPVEVLRVSANKILMANGIDPMLRWDGQEATAETAGLDPPTTASTLADGGAGALVAGTFYGYVRYVDAEGNPSNPSPVSAALVLGASKKISWSGIPTTSDTKVVKKQLLRNTTGQASTFYVVTEMTGAAIASTTTFSDNVTDATLLANEAVVIVDSEGQSQVTRWTVPPRSKASIAQHLGLVFAAVEISIDEGHVEVTNGSANAVVLGQPVPTGAVGRFLYIPGEATAEISAVPASHQITLTANWAGTTNKYARYAIRSSPGLQRTIQWSDPEYPEGWSPLNALLLPETGGELTGLASMGSYLYIIEDRAIHRFSFQNDPALGTIYLAVYRGCINNRCWVVVDENRMLLLDRRGVHSFDGGTTSEPLSSPIQEVFRESNSELRIQWRHTQYWHAVHDEEQETIRWFVTMSGGKRPRHALCYHYRMNRWWIEEYSVPIVSGCVATQSIAQVYMGGPNGRVYGVAYDAIDGVDFQSGFVGGVESSGKYDLTATNQTWPSDVVGCPVHIISGRGKGQWGVVASVSGKTLTTKTAWRVRLDATSRYAVGGIAWRYRSGRYRWVEDENNQRREVHVFHEPILGEARTELRIYEDFQDESIETHLPWGPKDDMGAVSLDLTKPDGYQLVRVDDARAQRTDGWRLISLEVAGIRTKEQIRIYDIEIDGAA